MPVLSKPTALSPDSATIRFPLEILLMIAEFVDNCKDLNSLARTSRALHAILQPKLERRALKHGTFENFPLVWAVVRKDRYPIAKRLMK